MALKLKKDIENLVEKLKKYKKVIAVILFGSYAKKKFKPMSDIDIAVVIKNPDKRIEAEISSYSSNLFDISLFHRLPLYIQFEVLKYGRVLFVRDEKYLKNLIRNVVKNYLELSYLYERIKKKVFSMRGVTIIQRLKKHVENAKKLKSMDLNDPLVFNSLALECFQAVNSAIDLGEYVVTELNLGIPSNYREIFELIYAKLISKSVLTHIKRLIFLRNLIAHEYYNITTKELREFANNLIYLEKFAESVKRLIE